MRKKILIWFTVALFIVSQLFIGYELSRMEKARMEQEHQRQEIQIEIRNAIQYAKNKEAENQRLQKEIEFWRDEYLKKTIKPM